MKVRHVMYVSAIAAMLSGGCGASTPPATPTGVVADTSTGAIKLTWNAAPGASNYAVFRGTLTGITNKTIVQAYLTSATYTNTPTEIGKQYCFQITSINDDGQSRPTDDVCATGTFKLLVSDKVFSWNSILNASSYKVYRSSQGDMSSAVEVSLVPLLGTDTDAASLTGTYYYQVAALDASSGELGRSDIVSVTY